MNSGRSVISQVIGTIHREALRRLATKYKAEERVRHFGCRQQFICMVFAQLTGRESLRDIETCLNASQESLYHLGFTAPVARSTLAEANERRDWRMWEELAMRLVKRARPLYADEDIGVDIEGCAYALDSTTVDLSLSLFPWADFRSTKAGVKLHTQIDLKGPIPTCIRVSEAAMHDVRWLDELVFEPGCFYIMDRGYMDFARLAVIASASAFFVTRAKDNLRFSRQISRELSPEDYAAGVCSDQAGRPTAAKSRAAFPFLLRRIRFHDIENQRYFVFLTNNLEVDALTIVKLYKLRWLIELFFKWIKGHLRIKHYYGTSANAVKTQIWTAMAAYLMVAILHKELKLPGTLHRTLQLLSVHPFSKVPVNELLMQNDFHSYQPHVRNQLTLFDL